MTVIIQMPGAWVRARGRKEKGKKGKEGKFVFYANFTSYLHLKQSSVQALGAMPGFHLGST